MIALEIYAVGVSLIAAIALVGWHDATTQYRRLSKLYWTILTERFGNDEAITRLGQE